MNIVTIQHAGQTDRQKQTNKQTNKLCHQQVFQILIVFSGRFQPFVVWDISGSLNVSSLQIYFEMVFSLTFIKYYQHLILENRIGP